MAGGGRFGDATNAAETLSEAAGLYRFEQVIDSVNFEGLNREIVMSSHEDDVDTIAEFKGFDDIEAGAIGKLNVEKCEVRLQAVQDFDGFSSGTRFTYYGEIRFGGEQVKQFASRGRFIIHQDRANHVSAGSRLRASSCVVASSLPGAT